MTDEFFRVVIGVYGQHVLRSTVSGRRVPEEFTSIVLLCPTIKGSKGSAGARCCRLRPGQPLGADTEDSELKLKRNMMVTDGH